MTVEAKKKTNGVDTERLVETVNAVKNTPKLGEFTFQINNRWIDGGQNRSEANLFAGQGQIFATRTSTNLPLTSPKSY